MKARSAIVGFCTNMPVDRARVLCKSARDVHAAEETEIVLITNQPEQYWEALHDLDVSFCASPCDLSPSTTRSEKVWKRLVVHGARLAGGTWLDRRLLGGSVARYFPTLAEAWCHPQIARWNAYVRVLVERPHVEKVLLVDTKDVIIQSNCFDYLGGEQLQLFMEGAMEESDWTARWIRSGFGDGAVRAMTSTGIQTICVGTLLGTRRSTLGFLGRVQAMLARYPFRTVDQGVMNWLLFREGDPEHVVRVPNITGAVATLSTQEARDMVVLRDGVIVRRQDGTVCPVVHMWDRWGDLLSSVLARYGEAPLPVGLVGEGRQAPPAGV